MLTGQRVRLRGIERSDLPRFVSWLNDPEVRQGISIVVPFSMAQEENWYENTLKLPLEEQPLAIEVKAESGWEHIGNIGLMNFNHRERFCEVGIMVGDRRYWGQGLGQDAMKLILQHGFMTLNLNRIFLRVYETNKRAIRSYEKVGFILEGRHRQEHFQNGRYIDMLYMSILRLEWKDVEI